MDIQINTPENKDIFYPGNVVEHISPENGIKTLVIVAKTNINESTYFRGMSISNDDWYISDNWKRLDFHQCIDKVILTHKGI